MRLIAKLFVFSVGAIVVFSACGSDSFGPSENRAHPTATPSFLSSEYRIAPTGSRYGDPIRNRPYSPPTGEPYDNTFFRDYGVNPFVSTEDERYSTFGMDVDTASYTISRSYIQDGNLPPADAVRVEEFVNYFDGDYPAADEALQVYLDGARSRFGEDNKHLLRIGVAAREILPEERNAVSLTFVIDVSGSMNRENRLDLAKRSLERLVNNLTRNDRVGIVVYGTRARTVLHPTSDRNEIRRAIKSLRAEGSTNAEAGLLMGYRLASDSFREGDNNRVILISDGVANVGKTGPKSILERVEQEANRNITLTAIGVGMGNYNDILLEQLADNGNGNYFYVDDDEEARRLFGTELISVLETVAMDAKIQVEFNPAVVERFRLLGYENRSLETEDFRDDSIDAGEVGAGHEVTALYELTIREGARGGAATVNIRYQHPETREATEDWREVTVDDLDRSFEQASPRFRFVASVAEFGEILRDSYWAEESSLEAVRRVASQALDDMDSSPAEREFVSLVQTAIKLNR